MQRDGNTSRTHTHNPLLELRGRLTNDETESESEVKDERVSEFQSVSTLESQKSPENTSTCSVVCTEISKGLYTISKNIWGYL